MRYSVRSGEAVPSWIRSHHLASRIAVHLQNMQQHYERLQKFDFNKYDMASSNPETIGYGLLSSLISSDADLSVFRSFKALNVRRIL